MTTYKLTYFNIRGRGELARLLFAVAGVKYEDKRVSRDEWQTLKPNTPQGKLPVLKINDNKELPQSLSISRYLARQFGLYGNTAEDDADCDVIMQTCEDVRQLRIAMLNEKDETQKAKLTKKFEEEDLPMYLDIFETYCGRNDDENGYIIGNSVTVADLAVYDVFENIVRNNPAVFSNSPKLATHRKKVAEVPKIKEYLKHRPDTEI